MDSIDILMGNPLFALFAVIGTGVLLGSIKVKGISLGSSGVLFTALICGHFGYTIPDEVGTIGLILFVYCVGISAGGRFFSALAKEGATMAKMGILIVGLGALVAWGCQVLMKIPGDLAVGIFAGALTSTPALATAIEGIGNGGAGIYHRETHGKRPYWHPVRFLSPEQCLHSLPVCHSRFSFCHGDIPP